jgi:hypothetical protein
MNATSPAPPAVGLSPESLMKYGRSRLPSAVSIHQSASPAAVLKPNCAREFQYEAASSRASRAIARVSVPVTTTAAPQRGSSANAYPIHTDASMIPGRRSIAASRPRAGSSRVEAFSPGNNTGTRTHARSGRTARSRHATRFATARRLVSGASSCGDMRCDVARSSAVASCREMLPCGSIDAEMSAAGPTTSRTAEA